MWIPCGPLSKLVPYRRFSSMGFSLTTTARDLILATGGAWPNNWMEICMNLHGCQTPALNDAVGDDVCWRSPQGSLGTFSVTDAYKDLSGHLATVEWAREVWFKGRIPKHAFGVWVACHGRLPTQDRLHWKHDPPDLKCPLCNLFADSHDHLFFMCDFSLEVWRTIKRDTRLYGFAERWQEISDNLVHGRGPKKREQKLALQATLYCIWRERNRRLFNNKSSSTSLVIKEVREVVLLRMAWVTFDDGLGSVCVFEFYVHSRCFLVKFHTLSIDLTQSHDNNLVSHDLKSLEPWPMVMNIMSFSRGAHDRISIRSGSDLY
ncbi:hypothetical protein OSB04_031220 [Centaurea solstitialis]|uniref:Reverse transcriptase zinc-binding domain-containing protein n=1 Tax=Centaurea solstitialis TaxID=347529 RepID=A0AA38VXE1_9ASTR|nr:hypothetical protein OSB04_031220 [Centaurea solstitialis]